jgi:hypothetical protein
MTLVAKSDLSTGNYVLQSNDVMFVITAPQFLANIKPDAPVAIPGYDPKQAYAFVQKHGLEVRTLGAGASPVRCCKHVGHPGALGTEHHHCEFCRLRICDMITKAAAAYICMSNSTPRQLPAVQASLWVMQPRLTRSAPRAAQLECSLRLCSGTRGQTRPWWSRRSRHAATSSSAGSAVTTQGPSCPPTMLSRRPSSALALIALITWQSVCLTSSKWWTMSKG